MPRRSFYVIARLGFGAFVRSFVAPRQALIAGSRSSQPAPCVGTPRQGLEQTDSHSLITYVGMLRECVRNETWPVR